MKCRQTLLKFEFHAYAYHEEEKTQPKSTSKREDFRVKFLWRRLRKKLDSSSQLDFDSMEMLIREKNTAGKHLFFF